MRTERPPTGTARARQGWWPQSTKDSGEKSPTGTWPGGRRRKTAGSRRRSARCWRGGPGLGGSAVHPAAWRRQKYRPQRAPAQSWGDGSPGSRPTGRPAALEGGLGFSGEAEQTRLTRSGRQAPLCYSRDENVMAPHPLRTDVSPFSPQPAGNRRSPVSMHRLWPRRPGRSLCAERTRATKPSGGRQDPRARVVLGKRPRKLPALRDGRSAVLEEGPPRGQRQDPRWPGPAEGGTGEPRGFPGRGTALSDAVGTDPRHAFAPAAAVTARALGSR